MLVKVEVEIDQGGSVGGIPAKGSGTGASE